MHVQPLNLPCKVNPTKLSSLQEVTTQLDSSQYVTHLMYQHYTSYCCTPWCKNIKYCFQVEHMFAELELSECIATYV